MQLRDELYSGPHIAGSQRYEEQFNGKQQQRFDLNATLPPNYILAAVYCIKFVTGVAGNLILITVNAWRRSSKQVATQLFITSLAVSDLGLLFAKTWISAFESVDDSFKFGRILCKISNFWTQFAANASITLLAALSVDRYSKVL